MNLVYIWIEEYRGIHKKGYVMNANYNVTKSNDFDFVIEKKDTLSIYANDKIIDSYLLLGKNGLGKTTLLKFISYKFLDEKEYCKICMIYEKDNKYYVYKHGFDDKDIINITSYYEGITSDKYHDLTETFIKYHSNFVSVYFEGLDYPYYYPFAIGLLKYLNSSILDFIVNDFNRAKNSVLGFDGNKDICVTYRKYDSTYRFLKEVLKSNNPENVKLLKITFLNCFFSFFHIYDDLISSNLRYVFSDFFLYDNALEYNNVEEFMICFHDFYKKLLEVMKDYEIVSIEEDNKELFYKITKEVLIQFDSLDFLKLKDNNIVFKLSDITDNKSNYNNLKEYLNTLKKYNLENTFEINASGSKGENAFIHNLAVIDTILNELKENITEDKIVYLCIDEIEQNLHPEWCRLLYSKISQLINTSNINNKFYLYMSTHSPYVISDFTSDHIINLDDLDNKNDFQTFGANIHDILSKGMFLDNPMGEYAYSMIRRVHKALCTGLSKEEILEASGMDSEEKLRYFIDNIGEPLIKMQLRSLYEKVFETGKNKIKISRNELKNVKTEEQLIQLLNNCNIEVE